jgi:DNA-binding response OmpR family regulator
MGVPIGTILVQRGATTQAMVDRAWGEAKAAGERLCSRLLKLGVDEALLVEGLAEQQRGPGVDLSRCIVDLALLELVPRAVAENDLLLPLSDEGGRLHLGMVSPNDHRLLSEVRFVSGREVSAYVAVDFALHQAIGEAYDARERGEEVWRGHAAGPGLPPLLAAVVPSGEVEVEISEDIILEVEATPLGEEEILTPLEDEPPPEAAPAPPAEPPAGPPLDPPVPVPIEVRPAGRRTVLVVDDEPEIRLLLQRSLEKHGYAVETAADGAEAVAKAEAIVPDLVLLDAMLPKVHGFEACQQIKASPRTRYVPVIMMTAIYRGWRFAQDARDTYGAEDYIEKPFRFDDVLRRIDVVLEATASRSRGDGVAATAEVERGKELLQANRLPEARAAFEAAIAADPYSAEAHDLLARALRSAGEAFSAMTAFEKSAELRPAHLPSLRALAALYEEKGFRRKAAETLERALGAAADEATRAAIKQDLLALLG